MRAPHHEGSIRSDCLSPVNLRPAETHRDPGCDQLPHELAGVTRIVRHVIGKLDAGVPLRCHDRMSSGQAPVANRFRNIDSQCPLVKSRNIAEWQQAATTRRVADSGLSRCSLRYSCPATHRTRSFRNRTMLVPPSGSSSGGAAGICSIRRPACWQLVQ
jgi:hypothetical protein